MDGCQWEATVNRRQRTVVPTEACRPSVLLPGLEPARVEGLARAFAAVADPIRLRILSIIAAAPDGEVCVCEFVGPLRRSQPTVSHHLKILSDAGLVCGDRRGKWVWYSLDPGRLAELRVALSDIGATLLERGEPTAAPSR
jgi:ArsR family transcriptional regulator, arsenate/arsenite/antimonite-responsive transcriptional repressor